MLKNKKEITPKLSEDVLDVLADPLQKVAIILGEGNPDRAKDLFQETLLQVWENKEKIFSSTSPVHQIRNLMVNIYTKQKREEALLDTVPLTSEMQNTFKASAESNPSAQMQYQELEDIVRAALTSRQFEAFMGHEVDKVTYREIAEEHGTTANNIRLKIGPAKRRLRRLPAHKYELDMDLNL